MACIDLLLQDTNCSPHQLDLLESAEACGLQLRGNIDNILLYSNIGSPSPRLEDVKKAKFPEFREDVNQEKNNLISLIEETIEREARKRKSALPSEGGAKNLLWTSDNPSTYGQRGICTIITVDANPQAHFTLARYSGISVIINNLLGNCIKFTGPDACIRISLETDDESVKLKFTDAGRGMTNDFIRHNLLVPFAQQDPLDTGTGLGLSLVQNAVQALQGETKIETDESRGTEVSVTIPRSRLVSDTSNVDETAPQPIILELPDHSTLSVRLLAPSRWQQKEDLRQERCLDALSTSLARTLSTWLSIDCSIWTNSEDIPDVFFLLHTDVERLRTLAGDSFDDLQKIILCTDAQAEAELQGLKPGTFETMIGPVTSSKVCATVTTCLQRIDRQRKAHADSRQGSCTSQSTTQTNGSHGDATSVTTNATEPDGDAESLVNQPDTQVEHMLPDRTTKKAPDKPTDPRFLLVDDNAINLKVVGMYAKKCSKQPSTSAGGGQEAIDAFTAATLASPENPTPTGFDVILLDLSMPEVSGFDVAAAIRKLERESGAGRTYIAALTGLVSDKDRVAAFAAGVDEYVTKPATVKDIHGVIANWRAVQEAPG